MAGVDRPNQLEPIGKKNSFWLTPYFANRYAPPSSMLRYSVSAFATGGAGSGVTRLLSKAFCSFLT
jgi:hypothetical protein